MKRCAWLVAVLLAALAVLTLGCEREPLQEPTKQGKEAPAIQGCIPQCQGKQCGDDGCRGLCGECPGRQTCDPTGHCQEPPCVPQCAGKECGDDGCGGTCGECPSNRLCNDAFQCIVPPCKPNCVNRACGADDCGGSCGRCDPGFICRDHQCIEEPCTADCVNRVCGDDGCGGTCGECPVPNACVDGRCERRIAVGFHLGDGTEPWRDSPPSVGEFSRKLGRSPAVTHAFVGFPADWSGKCEYGEFPTDWVDQWLSVNPVGSIMLTLLPQCGFPLFHTEFKEGNPAYEATVKFAKAVKKFPGPVFIRFAHDMNTHWYPWATCYFGNDRTGCAHTAKEYQQAFGNFARVMHQEAGEKAQLVWSVHEWEPYWGEKDRNYPHYAAFYPGDEHVDWVGISLYYQNNKPPRPGTLATRIRSFYDEFSSPGGHNKRMMISESAVECHVSEDLVCRQTLGDFNSIRSWWDGWGNLKMSRMRGSAEPRCRRLQSGHSHIVFEAGPDRFDPKGKPHAAPNYYVGGTGFALDWTLGNNFEKGNVLAFSAYREKGEVASVLQIELCDTDAQECPEDAPCCEKGTYSASVTIANTAWEVHVVPLSDFKPTVEGSTARLDWRHIRAIKLHLLAEQPTDDLPPLHVDGFGLGNWKRKGGGLCDKMVAGWAGQLFSPNQCYEWPNLKMIMWYHDRKDVRGDVRDYRIQDFELFKRLLTDPCFQGSFF